MNDANYKLTTVKVLSENYSKFKLETLSSEMTLQKLVNRAIKEYLTDSKFKENIDKANVYPGNSKY